VKTDIHYSSLDSHTRFIFVSVNLQAKIEWTLNLIRVTQQVSEKYFTHLEGTKGLYEIRVEVGSNVYCIFSFFGIMGPATIHLEIVANTINFLKTSDNSRRPMIFHHIRRSPVHA
jgi:hypothetical protein